MTTITASGVNLIKLFWSKFTHSFCKLDHFINVILFIYFLKRSSLSLWRWSLPDNGSLVVLCSMTCLLALPANIWLGWNWLKVTNTLAYHCTLATQWKSLEPLGQAPGLLKRLSCKLLKVTNTPAYYSIELIKNMIFIVKVQGILRYYGLALHYASFQHGSPRTLV
jgi:hypothetical protein